MACGVIVACVPTLGPVVFPKRFPTASQKYNVNKGDGSAPSNKLNSFKMDESISKHSYRRFDSDEAGLVSDTHSSVEEGFDRQHLDKGQPASYV